MWLRNKKTGGVRDCIVREKRNGNGEYSIIVCPIRKRGPWTILAEYPSLAKLYEEWEDYKSAEPLIEDPKIRKAVRVWAEVNDVKKVTVEKDFSTYAFYPADTDRVSISIWTEPSLSNLSRGNVYTIEELCGEEK